MSDMSVSLVKCSDVANIKQMEPILNPFDVPAGKDITKKAVDEKGTPRKNAATPAETKSINLEKVKTGAYTLRNEAGTLKGLIVSENGYLVVFNLAGERVLIVDINKDISHSCLMRKGLAIKTQEGGTLKSNWPGLGEKAGQDTILYGVSFSKDRNGIPKRIFDVEKYSISK